MVKQSLKQRTVNVLLCVLSWPLTGMEELPRSWFGSRSSIQYKRLRLSFPRSYRHWFPLGRFPCGFLRSILQSEQLCECSCLFFHDFGRYASGHQWREVCDIPHHWRWKTIANSSRDSRRFWCRHCTPLLRRCYRHVYEKRSPTKMEIKTLKFIKIKKKEKVYR